LGQGKQLCARLCHGKFIHPIATTHDHPDATGKNVAMAPTAAGECFRPAALGSLDSLHHMTEFSMANKPTRLSSFRLPEILAIREWTWVGHSSRRKTRCHSLFTQRQGSSRR
jgi:hypothetical protein